MMSLFLHPFFCIDTYSNFFLMRLFIFILTKILTTEVDFLFTNKSKRISNLN